MRKAQLEPAAVAALWSERGLDLGCRFEGFEAGVRKQRDVLSALAHGLDLAVEILDGAAADGMSAAPRGRGQHLIDPSRVMAYRGGYLPGQRR